MNHDDLLADLPSPRDDEPPSLRSDIADELLDHLQCAFRREVLKDGDEAAAEKRALARFGDPKKLARRLWRQAMWSRIMGKRILSGLQWLLTLAAVFLAGAVLWQQSAVLKEIQTARQEQRAEQQALAATLSRLLPATASDNSPKAPPPLASYSPEDAALLTVAPMTPMEPGVAWGPAVAGLPRANETPPMLTVKLVVETEDGPPVVNMIHEIALRSANKTVHGEPRNQAIGGAGEAMQSSFGNRVAIYPRSSADGRFDFRDAPPDRYELRIKLHDGQHTTQPVLIRDDKPRELTVICPSPRVKAPVLITGPALSEKVQSKANEVKYYVEETPIILGTVEWFPPESTRQIISFDAATRLPVKVDVLVWDESSGYQYGKRPSIDLAKSNSEDRAIFLLTGPVQAAFVEVEFDRGRGGVTSTAPDSLLRNTVEPGENVWTLAWTRQAEEFLFGPSPSDAAQPDAPVDEAKDAANKPTLKSDEPKGADAKPLGDRCRLTVKLTTESEDPAALQGAKLSLIDEQNNAVSMTYDGDGGRVNNNLRFDADGTLAVRFEPGRYVLNISFPDGRELRERQPLFRAGQERMETIACPPPASKTSVLITTTPIPEDHRRQTLSLNAVLMPVKQTIDDREWVNIRSNSHNLFFDEANGQLKAADDVNLNQEPPEDRLIFVTAGPFAVHLMLHQLLPGQGEAKQIAQLVLPAEGESPYVAKAGENNWEIKVPDEFWEMARKTLAEETDKK